MFDIVNFYFSDLREPHKQQKHFQNMTATVSNSPFSCFQIHNRMILVTNSSDRLSIIMWFIDTNIISNCDYFPHSAFTISLINQIHVMHMLCNHYQIYIASEEAVKINTSLELKSQYNKHPNLFCINSQRIINIWQLS